jgi:hypothetical protein
MFRLKPDATPVNISCGSANVSQSVSPAGTLILLTLERQQDQCTLTPLPRLVLRARFAVAITQFSASVFESNLALAAAVDSKHVRVISTDAGSTIVNAQVGSNSSEFSCASLQRIANTLNSAAANGTLNLGYGLESFQAVGPLDDPDHVPVVVPAVMKGPTFFEKWRDKIIIMASVAVGLVNAVLISGCIWLRCKKKPSNAVIDSSTLVNGVDVQKLKPLSNAAVSAAAASAGKRSLLQMVQLANPALTGHADKRAVLLARSFRLLVGYFGSWPERMSLRGLFDSSQAVRPKVAKLLQQLALPDTAGVGPSKPSSSSSIGTANLPMLPAPSACWNGYALL